MAKSRRSMVAAVLTAGALSLTACGGAGSAENTSGEAKATALTIGSLVDVTSWDPAQAHVGHFLPLYQAAYDSLIQRMPDGSFEPMLAKSWKYNDDKTELTLELRTDVTFSDGEKFDADAVKANLDHFAKANGPQATTVNGLESVDPLDADTVKIELDAANPALLTYLSNAAGLMGSPKALGTDSIKGEPVGSGPYVMDKSASLTGSTYAFKKNDEYWNKDLQKFDAVTFKFLADTTARLNALVSGQIDATLLDAKSAQQAKGGGMQELTQQVDWAGLFLFDRAGAQSEPLGNMKVRQAINHALDRQAILDGIYLGQGSVTSQIAGVNSAAYDPELDDYYSFDLDKATALMADAGYANGFTLKLPTTSVFDPVIFSTIVQQLGAIGITVEQVSVPAADYRNEVLAGNFVMAYYSIFQGEPWIAIGHHIGQNAAFNPFKYGEAKSKDLISQVQQAKEGDSAPAKALNKYLTEQAWFAPIMRPNQMYYYNKKLTVENEIEQAVPSLYNYAPAS